MNEAIDPLRGVGIALEMKGGSFAWDMELKAEDLRNINFRADAGKTLISYRLFPRVILFYVCDRACEECDLLIALNVSGIITLL